MEISSDIWGIVIRTVAVYFFIIIGLLLMGRKELSQLRITDLVFILLISNSVQNAMVGTNSTLEGGLIAASVLILMDILFRFLNYKFKFFRDLAEGDPQILIYEGKLNKRNIKRERITENELLAAIREHGVEKIEEVTLAMLEIDGQISVISHDILKKTKHARKGA